VDVLTTENLASSLSLDFGRVIMPAGESLPALCLGTEFKSAELTEEIGRALRASPGVLDGGIFAPASALSMP